MAPPPSTAAKDMAARGGVHELERERRLVSGATEPGVAVDDMRRPGGAPAHLGLVLHVGVSIERHLEREHRAGLPVARLAHPGEATRAEVADPVNIRQPQLLWRRRCCWIRVPGPSSSGAGGRQAADPVNDGASHRTRGAVVGRRRHRDARSNGEQVGLDSHFWG
ncbi:hypothetical protein PAHAL_4G344200 [Panicum hallii]|uniref:Uncharacterized protein n=1 Tax=Panicum hallii TaxID=206008 RepID=A0A2S3HMQ8_9POAL|nr:hypothetical protein PAHAL_4G344200 [Panicum hallii]